MRFNIIQIVIIVILIPIFCFIATPILKLVEPTNLLLVFQETKLCKYFAEIIQDGWQGWKAGMDAEGTWWNVFDALVIDTMGESVVGGLCVSLCFRIWSKIPIARNSLPLLPAFFSTFFACIFLTFEKRGDLISALVILNFISIILTNLHDLTNFVLMLVKFIFGLLFGCAISSSFTVCFCIMTMMITNKISGIFPVVLMMFMGICGILITIFEWLVNRSFDEPSQPYGG